MERIGKVLAAAGFGSRRSCEQWVTEGRVRVNGRRTAELPLLVDPEKDHIVVDGKPLRAVRRVYYLLHKPRGVYCTQNDPDGRTRAVDLMKGVRQRVFPVGRLDADSAGLLIMTNDGELTQKLTHPRFATPKTYRVEVQGCPSAAVLEKLRRGVWLSEGKTAPATIKVVHKDRLKAALEITLREGRNREIRRMLARLGHKVRRLTRIRMGRLSIRNLPAGGFRRLTEDEVKYLYRLAARSAEKPEGGGAGRKQKKVRSRGSSSKPVRSRGRSGKPGGRQPQGKDAPSTASAQGPKRRIILPND